MPKILVTSLLALALGLPSVSLASPRVDTSQVPIAGSLPSQHELVSCDKYPPRAGAILRLSQPAAAYAQVLCTSDANVIAPIDGYVWLPSESPGQPFFLSVGLDGGVETDKAYFANERSGVLPGFAVDQANKVLVDNFRISQQFENVIRLDVLTASRLEYNLYFYLAAESRPYYVLVCVDRCNRSFLLREYPVTEAASKTRDFKTTPAPPSITGGPIWSALTQASAWQKIGDYDDRSMYIDKDHMIIEGAVRTFLLKVDFKSPQQTDAKSPNYKQSMQYMRLDCEKNIYANLQVSNFMDGVRVGYTSYYPNKAWRPISPESPGSEIQKAACK